MFTSMHVNIGTNITLGYVSIRQCLGIALMQVWLTKQVKKN